MRTHVMHVAATIGLSFASVALADQAQPAPAGEASAVYLDRARGVSPDDAVRLAMVHDPSLRAARAEVDVARGMRRQADLRPNPSVSFSQVEEAAGADRQSRIDVVVPLDLFRRSPRIDVANHEIEVARHDVQDRERTRAAAVRAAYGDVAAELQELLLLEDLVRIVAEQHELISARVDQGVAPPLERDVLFVERQRLAAERSVRAAAVERAMFALKRAIGVEPSFPLKIQSALVELVTAVHAAPAAPGGSLDQRSDVRAAEARVRTAAARVGQARREGRPDVSLVGMYMRMDAGFPQSAFGRGGTLEPIRGTFHYVSAGATMTVPLSNRNQGEAAAAEARRAQATADLDAARLDAASEVATARAWDAGARAALAAYSPAARSLARQNLEVVSRTYVLGRATVFDVLAEERRYLESERAYTAMLREAYDASRALRQALGEPR